MPTRPSATAQLLSLISAVCAAAASLATLLSSGAFPPPPGASGVNVALAEARGWSLVTLVVALWTNVMTAVVNEV